MYLGSPTCPDLRSPAAMSAPGRTGQKSWTGPAGWLFEVYRLLLPLPVGRTEHWQPPQRQRSYRACCVAVLMLPEKTIMLSVANGRSAALPVPVVMGASLSRPGWQ
jgi:hypothetical protein